jgi:NADH-quinone oxidoreductase subunit J
MWIDIVLTILTIVFALMVVFSKRTVVSAFSLLVALLCVAMIYFQLGSNFLAAIQVLVNAGAVAILFVFVMMLINLDAIKVKREKNLPKLIVSTLTILVAMGVFALILNNNIEVLGTDRLTENSMLDLFQKLFTMYYLPFELATVLMLAAIVSAVVLTGQYKPKQGK